MKNKKILCLFSHPDDAEIYSAGLLLKLRYRVDVEVCIVFNVSVDKEIRENETKKAMEMLGTTLRFLNMQDDAIQNTFVLDTKINALIESSQPNLIITHNPLDYHTDHILVSESVKRVASYKIPVLYTDTLNGNDCVPDLFCDITEFMTQKKKLIGMHQSQIEKCDYRTICEIVNHFRGIQYFGKPEKYCEAYCLSTKYHMGQIIELISNEFLI